MSVRKGMSLIVAGVVAIAACSDTKDPGLDRGPVGNDSGSQDGGVDGPAGNDATPPGPSRITIDPALATGTAKLPPFFDGGPARQIGVMVGPTGNQYRLLEEEILIATKTKSELDQLLAPLGGTVLDTWSFANQGDTSGYTYYGVKITSASVSRVDLEEALQKLGLEPGKIRVSSEAVLGTLAAFAAASRRGVGAFPNFILESNGIADRFTSEALIGIDDHAAEFTRNPFEWPYMKRGGPMDIGVAEAWRALAANGKLATRVPVLVMDGGFRQTPDMPADTVLVSGTAWDQENPALCGGVRSCPWHGTGSARVVAAMVDDNFGGAGIAGPVARPYLLQSPVANFFDYIRFLAGMVAGTLSAKIINISASTTIDQWICDVSGFWLGEGGVCRVPHHLGLTLQAAGFLLISSAGNQGSRDLDSGDFTIPCEMEGTFCVGGMNWNSTNRHPDSSYASKHQAIDLWAPWAVWVGPNPEGDLTLNQAKLFTGTSASAPFVSGVAALVSAANPSLTGSQIANILRSTAHVNPSTSSHVRRWVNAYAAVSQALGGKMPPFIRIVQPVNGEVAPRIAGPVQFEAVVESTSPATVAWSSSLDGDIGSGAKMTYSGLSFGTHTIVAQAQANGVGHSASITIERTNVAPVMAFLEPANGADVLRSQPLSLLGTSFDVNEVGSKLTDAQVTWWLGASKLGTGHAVVVPANTLPLGIQTLELHGNDGVTTSKVFRSVGVKADTVDLPPIIGAITPANGTDLGYADTQVGTEWYKAVTLTGSATDPDGPVLPASAFTWTTTYKNASGVSTTVTLGTGKTLSTKLIGICNVVQHTVTLTVTDGLNTVKKSVVLTVRTLC